MNGIMKKAKPGLAAPSLLAPPLLVLPDTKLGTAIGNDEKEAAATEEEEKDDLLEEDMTEWDCLLLYNYDDSSKELPSIIKTVVEFMAETSIAVFVPQRKQGVPGYNIKEVLKTAIAEANVVILLLAQSVNETFLKLVDKAMHALLNCNPGVIPLFVDMKPAEAKVLVDDKLPVLSDKPRILTKSPIYLQKLIDAITTPNHLTEALHARYKDMKQQKPTILGSFRLSDQISSTYVPPICDTKTMVNHKCVTGTLIDYSGDMIKVIGMAHAGDRIVIHGEQGMGKTHSLRQCAIQWQNEHTQLKHYNHAYLLPVKEIRNRSQALEKIICNDVGIAPEYLTTSVKINLRDKTTSSLILIDGYDELRDYEIRDSTIPHIISGEVAKSAVVIVSTRTECLTEVLNLTGGNCTLLTLGHLNLPSLYTFAEQGFPNDLNSFTSVCKLFTKDDHPVFPRDLLHKPFYLAISSYICKMYIEKKKNLETVRPYETPGALISKFWGHMLYMKETGKNSFELDLSSRLLDEKISADLRSTFDSVSRMSFECLDKGQYLFTKDISDNYLDKKKRNLKLLRKLGPVNVSDDRFNFCHTVFQEFCAALHVAKDMGALHKLFRRYKARDSGDKQFERLRNVLAFAVSIRPTILDEIPSDNLPIPLLVSSSEEAEFRIDLSVETELVNECKVLNNKKQFISRLLCASFKPVKYVDSLPIVNHRAYEKFLCDITYEECLKLVKRAFGVDVSELAKISTSDDKIERAVLRPPEGSSHLVISDPIILTVLPSLDLGDTKTLSIHNISSTTFRHLTEDMSKSVIDIDELSLTSPTVITTWQIVKLIEHVTNSGHLKVLRLCEQCVITSDCEAVSKQKVEKLTFSDIHVENLYVETSINRYLLAWLTENMKICQLHFSSTVKSKVGYQPVFTGCNVFAYNKEDVKNHLTNVDKVIITHMRGEDVLLRYFYSPDVKEVTVYWADRIICDDNKFKIVGEQSLSNRALRAIFPNAMVRIKMDKMYRAGDRIRPLTVDMVNRYWDFRDAKRKYKKRFGMEVKKWE